MIENEHTKAPKGTVFTDTFVRLLWRSLFSNVDSVVYVSATATWLRLFPPLHQTIAHRD